MSIEEHEPRKVPASYLRRCLGYVLAACPKKGEDPLSRVIFAETRDGVPYIAARDHHRIHYGYMEPGDLCDLRGSVERHAVADLHALLGGVEQGSLVSIDLRGDVVIDRPGLQPTIRHSLAAIEVSPTWEPPSMADEVLSLVPSRIPSKRHKAATAWPDAIIEVTQSNAAIATYTLKIGPRVVARARIAEDEHYLCPDEAPAPKDKGNSRGDGTRRYGEAA